MQCTEQTLIEQMRISPLEIRRRKSLLGFGPEDEQILSELKPLIAEEIEVIVDAFYTQLLQFDEIDRLIGDAGSLSRLKHYQRQYILTLFDGEYEEEYVHSRLRVGVVHRRIGVESKYFLSGVYHLKAIVQEVIIRGAGHRCGICGKWIAAIDKILMFDTSLIVDTYIESLMADARNSRRKLDEYVQSLEETVAQRTRKLAQQARHDGLTGLLNQHAFYRELKRELIRSGRLNHTVALLYFDLDGFKGLNDTQGHQAGDEILKKTAEAITRVTRENEVTARYGGDEFCIILPESNLDQGRAVAQRVCNALETALAGSGVTCSIGLAASSPAGPLDAAALVKAADSAMYRAKQKNGFALSVQREVGGG